MKCEWRWVPKIKPYQHPLQTNDINNTKCYHNKCISSPFSSGLKSPVNVTLHHEMSRNVPSLLLL